MHTDYRRTVRPSVLPFAHWEEAATSFPQASAVVPFPASSFLVAAFAAEQFPVSSYLVLPVIAQLPVAVAYFQPLPVRRIPYLDYMARLALVDWALCYAI